MTVATDSRACRLGLARTAPSAGALIVLAFALQLSACKSPPRELLGSAKPGAPCGPAKSCPEGQMCAGPEGCGTQWTCVPDRPCTADVAPFCSCDGETFTSSSSCPGKPYKSRGACTAGAPSVPEASGAKPAQIKTTASPGPATSPTPPPPALSEAELKEVCALLGDLATQKALPSAREYLCLGQEPACAGKDEAQCAATPNCWVRRGSGSGPGCNPCTPDMVFWGCDPVPKDQLAKSVLQIPLCRKSGGTWNGACQCGDDRAFLARRGCVGFDRLCAEAGGTWFVLDPNAHQISEFLPLSQCEAKLKARWEPPPAPPVGLCEFEGLGTAWPCDQGQRKEYEQRRILRGYRETAAPFVLCTHEVAKPPPPAQPLYQKPAPGNTNTVAGFFCRKDGVPFTVTVPPL